MSLLKKSAMESKILDTKSKSLGATPSDSRNPVGDIPDANNSPEKTKSPRKRRKKRHIFKPKKSIIIGNSQRYILGSGSYGVVYSSNLKTAYKSYMLMELEWIREVAVMKYLSHPSIVKYRKVGVVLDNKFDLEAGKFLRKKIYTAQAQMGYHQGALGDLKKFTDPEILLVMNNISSAITYSHDRDILHRDIKEGNILVDIVDESISKVMLCDFGLGKYSISSDQRPEYEMITISHRPPELELSLAGDIHQVLAMGQERINQSTNGKEKDKPNYELLFRYDNRVDVWSVCMVLVFMMTGESFYGYVHQKGLEFSYVLKNIDEFYILLNKFLSKYVNRSLEHLDFYMEILRIGLNRYENRPAMVDILRMINKYIQSNKIEISGDLYAAPEKITAKPKFISAEKMNNASGNVQFCYKKKISYDPLVKSLKEAWQPLIHDIDFRSVLTKERLDNNALLSATNNLYHASIPHKDKISLDINIHTSDGMIFASCYALACLVLVDLCNENPVVKHLVNDSSIFQVMLKILSYFNYNIIPLFKFVQPEEEKLEYLIIGDKIPSPEVGGTIVNSLSLKQLSSDEVDDESGPKWWHNGKKLE